MSRVQNVLIVEDSEPLRRTLAGTLTAKGYAYVEADSVASARERLDQRAIDVVILDLTLPDCNGLKFLGEMRVVGDLTPVIVLSARDDEATIVRALDLGADDYITKPFSAPELLARIRSALRHGMKSGAARQIVCLDHLTVDFARRAVTKFGADVKLSRKEYDLLEELAMNVGRPVAHERLLEAVWGAPDADIRYLRVYVGQIRGKIEVDPQRPTLLVAEPGYGYRLG